MPLAEVGNRYGIRAQMLDNHNVGYAIIVRDLPTGLALDASFIVGQARADRGG